MKYPAFLFHRFLCMFPVVFCLLSLTFIPTSVDAHATLKEAYPAPNSSINQSPETIQLTFSEQLEQTGYEVQVFNAQSQPLKDISPRISADRTQLTVSVPTLSQGYYLVSYRVISIDGHSIEGSFPFTIELKPEVKIPEPITLPGYDAHQHESHQTFSISMVMQYVARGMWYIFLLTLIGWMVWLRLLPSTLSHRLPYHRKVLQTLLRLHLLSLLLVVATNLDSFFTTLSVNELKSIFFATSVGLSLSGLLLLAIIGLFCLGRSSVVDFLWIVSVLAFKGISGHAVVFSIPELTIFLNTIHLFIGSLWIAGLLVLFLSWRAQETDIRLLLPRFSFVMMISFAVMTVTGIAMMSVYLPRISYVFYSLWGIFLLTKITIVFITFGISLFTYPYIRNRQLTMARRLVSIQISAMVLVLLLVGFISNLAPLPENEKLNWHVMGDTIHMTSEISPMQSGTNTFRVKVWLDEKSGIPQSVEMVLHYADRSEVAPIAIPLRRVEVTSDTQSFGLVQHTYETTGSYLTLRGKYDLKVQVVEASGQVTSYEKEFRLY